MTREQMIDRAVRRRFRGYLINVRWQMEDRDCTVDEAIDRIADYLDRDAGNVRSEFARLAA